MRNKVVFITGATSGIGEACAEKFAAQGALLILNGRNLSKLASLSKRLYEQYGTKSLELPFDVRDRATAVKAIESLTDEWEKIDILINNAGLVLGVDKEHQVDLEEADVMIDTNIRGLLTITRLIVPGMIARNSGHIINIGSIAGEYAYAGGSVYCATKAAVKMLSDGLRIDLVDTPLRVTNIRPGMVETNFSVVRYRGDKQQAAKVYEGLQPLTGSDIADTIVYAASVPPHIQIADILIMPTQQATANVAYRKN